MRSRSALAGYLVCAALSALALALGYLQANMPAGSIVAVAIAAAWLVLRSRWPAVRMAALIALVFEAALGIQSGLEPLLMLAAGVAALCAWDLDGFERRLVDAGQAGVARTHLVRLGVMAAGGYAFGALPMLVHWQLNFWTALLLGLLVLLLLAQTARLMLRAPQ